MFMISEMQGRIKTSLVTKDVIVNLSPVFKRLESDVYLCRGLLKNNILKCFRWPVFYGMIHLVRTQNFSKNYYFLPSDRYTYQLINELSHIETNSSSCIYLIFINQPNLSGNSGFHSPLLSNCHQQIVYTSFNLDIYYPHHTND